MKIILIDDEIAQLELLNNKIKQHTSYEVIGMFTNPHQGLIEISQQHPDLVFLDISMPSINGIDLAKEIKVAMPNTKIIFLTAYKEYALDAFNLQADDYLLKPLSDERLLQAFSKIEGKPTQQYNARKPFICSFHNLHFRDENFQIQSQDVKWRTTKAREIFAFLLHNREQFVKKDSLVEYLWPEDDLKQAYSQLYTTIYQIRKTIEQLGYDITIISSDNSYKLQFTDVVIDVDAFEDGIKELPFITKDNIQKHKDLLKVYTGDYFYEEDFIWAANERRRLHVKYVNHAKRVGDFFVFTEDYMNAILVYLELQKVSPYQEDSYFTLMKLYNKMNDRFAVKEQYEQLTKVLWEEFKEKPNEEITTWYHSLQSPI